MWYSLSFSSSIIPNRMNNDVVKNVFSQQRGLHNGANTNPSYLTYSQSIKQSFWVVLLFLRKQMLRILKHTFTDQHPPPPLVSLVHPPPPQQDVRIISCTYKEVCSCQFVKYIYIYLVCSYSPSSHVIIIKRESYYVNN